MPDEIISPFRQLSVARKRSDKLSRLGWRLVAATVAFSTVAALLATFTQLFIAYRHDLGTIESTFVQVRQSYLPTIANAVWATNHKELQVALDGLVHLPDVRHVVVMENDKVLAHAGSPKAENIQSRDYPLIHVHRGETLTIGSLQVVVDMAGVYQRLLDKFWVILVTNGIKTFLVAGFMLWLFRSLVTRHLHRIADFSARLNPANLHERLTLDRPEHADDKLDELDLVVDGFSRMQFNLAAAVQTLEQDIVKLEQAEAEIQQLNTVLEQRVAERTAQLEASNQELEAFSYSISHDLRAPLRGIDGFSQVLLKDYAAKLDDRGKDYLQRVRAAAQRMAELIDVMLNLARVTRAPMQRAPVDLSALATDITDELRQAQPGRTVEVVIQPGLVADGDAKLLKVLLVNLLANAWRFTGKQERARIEFGMQPNGGVSSYFVRDNGAGFDMTYVGKLFGAFQRLHTSAEFPGTGVGLATVQRIVHRHGGRAWAEAAVEQGATFFFTLAPVPVTT